MSSHTRSEQGLAASSHHEVVAEASYQAIINDWLSVQPDLQYIANPGAISEAPGAWIGGIRLNLNF